MPRLRNSRVLRKPNSGSNQTWKSAEDLHELRLDTRYDKTDKRELRLSFTTSASGGSYDTPGHTNVRVLIGTKDYSAILKAMCDVARETTLAAMSAKLAYELKSQSRP